MVHGMSLEPPFSQNRRTLHMVTLKDVLSIVAEIDDILKRELGGKGRGIHSKLDSVRPPLPSQLDKRLRYFEAVRNKALMQPDWRIPDRPGYISECQVAARRLRAIARKRARLHRLQAALQRVFGALKPFAFVAVAMGVLFVWASRS